MMSRAQVLTLQIAVALTAITGIVFAWMKYAMKSDDPFAVVNHPLQPWMLSAHVVAAPVAVFAFGWIFGNHIAPAFANRAARKRPSGVSAMWMLVPMIASGYLMQVSTADALRKAMAVAHWISSAAFVVAYIAHVFLRRSVKADAGFVR
jgi:hypothetical protein